MDASDFIDPCVAGGADVEGDDAVGGLGLDVLIHDFGGHPFAAELSRELAARGHKVDHAYFAGDIGPKGRLAVGAGDPGTLSFSPLGADIPYSKSDFFKRRRGDIAYGRRLAEHVLRKRPEMVVCGNSPTDVVARVLAAARKVGAAFVYWVQDYNGLGAKHILGRSIPVAGAAIGRYYMHLDRQHLLKSDHRVLITQDFFTQLDDWGVDRSTSTVIENWAPLSEISVQDRDTEWARECGLAEGARFMYSGTLARKHNPRLITHLTRRVNGSGQVLLVSSGIGADELGIAARDLPALRAVGLQPIERFGEVLASADVFLGMLEREAGVFSVPSKVLSYLSAGRPIVLAAPSENLASRIIKETGAGVVVDPEDADGFAEAALHFATNKTAAAAAGAAGRAYAERNFPVEPVADRFETVFEKALAARNRR